MVIGIYLLIAGKKKEIEGEEEKAQRSCARMLL